MKHNFIKIFLISFLFLNLMSCENIISIKNPQDTTNKMFLDKNNNPELEDKNENKDNNLENKNEVEDKIGNKTEISSALKDNIFESMKKNIKENEIVEYKSGEINVIDKSISFIKDFLIKDLTKLRTNLVSINMEKTNPIISDISNKDFNELSKKKDYLISQLGFVPKDIKVKNFTYMSSNFSEKAINFIPSLIYIDKDGNEKIGPSISIEIFPFYKDKNKKQELIYKYRIR